MSSPLGRLVVHAGSASTTAGGLASAMWARDRGLEIPASRWYVEIDLGTLAAEPIVDDERDSHFHMGIYSEEWGFKFAHGGRSSWIRVTDVPFAHVRDDFNLLDRTISLAMIGGLLRRLEQTHGITFRRDLAAIRTDLVGASRIRRWIDRL
jgi:hypothetical protein